MPNNGDVLPVLPTLAYANPRGGQPLDGRLRVEHQGNRTIVTDPQSAATSPMLLKFIGMVLLVVGIASAMWSVNIFISHRADFPDPDKAIGAIVSAICGAIILWRAAGVKQAPRVLEVAEGKVITTGIPNHGWVCGRSRPRRFIAKGGATDLLTLKRIHSIHINYGLGFSCLLLPNLSKDEAIWATHVLNEALCGDQAI